MFVPLKWLPTNDIPKQSDYLTLRFNSLMQFEQANVKKSYELAKESELKKEAHDITQISLELKRQNHNEIIDAKLRQKLRNENDELRKLKNHLAVAHISLDLANQSAANDSYKTKAARAKDLGRMRAESECLNAMQDAQNNKNKSRQAQQKLRCALLHQIDYNKKRQLSEQQEVINERQQRIIREQKIKEEDEQKRKDQIQRMIETRNEMYHFMEVHEQREQSIKVHNQNATDEYFKHEQEMERLKRLQKEAKLEKLKKHQDMSAYIGEQVYLIEGEKRQHQQLLIDLLEQEHKAKEDRLYQETLKKKCQERLRIKEELNRCQIERAAKNLEISNNKIKEAMQARATSTSTDHSLGMERTKKLHELRKQHGELLCSMIEENERRQVEAAATNKKFFELQSQNEAKVQKIVFEERVKMLKSVKPEVLRYLRNGVLTNMDLMQLEGSSLGK